jgi:hypothetical protein
MLRAEVSVEVCHVEEQGKSTRKRQTKGKKRSKKTQTTRKKPKRVDSDWVTETAVSGWEDDDDLNASEYLQGGDPGLTLIRKRSVEDTLPSTESGNSMPKRPRTRVHEVD